MSGANGAATICFKDGNGNAPVSFLGFWDKIIGYVQYDRLNGVEVFLATNRSSTLQLSLNVLRMPV